MPCGHRRRTVIGVLGKAGIGRGCEIVHGFFRHTHLLRRSRLVGFPPEETGLRLARCWHTPILQPKLSVRIIPNFRTAHKNRDTMHSVPVDPRGVLAEVPTKHTLKVIAQRVPSDPLYHRGFSCHHHLRGTSPLRTRCFSITLLKTTGRPCSPVSPSNACNSRPRFTATPAEISFADMLR